MNFSVGSKGLAATVAALLGGALVVDVASSPAEAQTSSPKTVAPKGDQAAPASSDTAAKKPAGKKAAGQPAAGDQKSTASYAIGVSVGSELRRSGVTADEISGERLAAGLRDALAGKAQMSQDYQQAIMGVLKKAHESAMANRAKEAEPNHAAAAAFLADNGKKKDIVTTTSGLEYKVLTPGSGDPPKPGDIVTVNYRGTLLNGTEFDSSAKHVGPAQFPSNQVIPGWQEALTLMKPGAKYQLFIPPKLAYDLESPPSIPPGSMLIFDVELVSIKPAGGPGGAGAGPGTAQPKAPPPPPK